MLDKSQCGAEQRPSSRSWTQHSTLPVVRCEPVLLEKEKKRYTKLRHRTRLTYFCFVESSRTSGRVETVAINSAQLRRVPGSSGTMYTSNLTNTNYHQSSCCDDQLAIDRYRPALSFANSSSFDGSVAHDGHVANSSTSSSLDHLMTEMCDERNYLLAHTSAVASIAVRMKYEL